MARENQGLKGALIVFVLLTIVFAVITAILFSGQTELKQKADANEKRATASDAAARKALDEMAQIKTMMGYDPNDKIETIQDEFNKDMQLYAGTDPKEARDYRQVVERQAKTIENHSASLKESATQIAARDKTITSSQTVAKTEIDQISAESEQAKADRTAELERYASDRQRIEGQQQQLDTALQQSRQEKEAELAQMNDKLNKTNEDLSKIGNAYKTVKKQNDNLIRETPDVFLGTIKFVNQRSGTAWIGLGSADALRPQTTFSVYGTEASEASEVTKKASIKVTQILNEHLAEAKIIEDDSTNPIISGDKIFTPIWSLGEKRRFAITGIADLDGDGSDDYEQIHSLIELNGGVVDARMTKDGKREGNLTLNTRYLILGETPGITSSPELLKDYTDMNREAEQLHVETITLRKFLEMVGWKHEAKVVSHDDSKPRSGSAVERDESPTTSTGRINSLFQPRKPPRANGGSTF